MKVEDLFLCIVRGVWQGAGAVAARTRRTERVVWEPRAPATAHGAQPLSFLYICAHISFYSVLMLFFKHPFNLNITIALYRCMHIILKHRYK